MDSSSAACGSVVINVSVLLDSTVVSRAEAQAVVGALQKQITQDFAPIWQKHAQVVLVPADQAPAPGSWWLAILDDTDQAGQAGYHDLTLEGLPLGKVFAHTDKQQGLAWSVSTSHELLEMLVDPELNLAVLINPGQGQQPQLYAYEIADPCQSDDYGYTIDSILVSDFVTPAYFMPSRDGEAGLQLDMSKRISHPLELLPGGYRSAFDFAKHVWEIENYASSELRPRAEAREGSRKTLRQRPSSKRRRSALHQSSAS